LKQKINDDIEERKIHEKKGVMMVKELKRQLTSERKRAEKLQKKLQDLLSESSFNSVTMDGNVKTNGNDSSSVGSWSFMFANKEGGGRVVGEGGPYGTGSQHSGSEVKDSSPGPASLVNESLSKFSETAVELEHENAQLVSRLSQLQQEKWALEERTNQLEVSLAELREELLLKKEMIQFYCMEGRSDPQHGHHQSPLHADKLTVKRVVDFMKNRGDENMKEINRKLQRMLEEILTKNMHLQQNLETISDELVRLKANQVAVQ
jgi:hypothetical protein